MIQDDSRAVDSMSAFQASGRKWWIKRRKGTHTTATFKKRFKEVSLLLTSYWPELHLRADLPARSMINAVFIQHTKIRKWCYKRKGTLRGNSPQEEGICTVALAPPYCPGDRFMGARCLAASEAYLDHPCQPQECSVGLLILQVKSSSPSGCQPQVRGPLFHLSLFLVTSMVLSQPWSRQRLSVWDLGKLPATNSTLWG